MGKIVSRIVLTGGPCAGKTNSLYKIEEHFEELGYKVIVVPEAATLLINGGIRPFGNFCLSAYEFQNCIIKLQLQNEALFESMVDGFSPDTKCIIVYDRGIVDGNAYIDDESFEKLLSANNLTMSFLFEHYDMVVHLVTAANGAQSFYTLENNCARKESLSEAISLDSRTMSVWSGHPNFNVVDNSTDFKSKIDRVINLISYNLGIGFFVRKQEKYLVDISSLSCDFFDNVQKIDIEQSYLGMQDFEKRLRKRIVNGVVNYYLTIQRYDKYGQATVYLNRRIGAADYYNLLSTESSIRTIHKVRYIFIYENEQYRLDVFDDGRCVLENNSNSSFILTDGI